MNRRLVHFSDLHLFARETSPLEVLDRRFIGYLRWRLARSRQHDEGLLKILKKDLKRLAPDQVLITGDLTHLGLPREFEKALFWLKEFGPPEKVMLVPGNHDAYRFGPWEKTFSLWRPYFCGEDPSSGHVLEDYFPSLRRLGPIALIGVNTACPNFPPLAIGRMGKGQLARLAELLRKTKGLWRMVLLHHPPLAGVTTKRKALLDLEALGRILREEGAELVLFGHTHRRYVFSLGQTLILGAPSITYAGASPRKRAAYFCLEVQGEGLFWQERVFDPKTQSFVPGDQGFFKPRKT